MKHAIVFSTLLAVAAGFFALGDAQRDAFRADVLAANTLEVAPVSGSAYQVAAADIEDDADADDGASAAMLD